MDCILRCQREPTVAKLRTIDEQLSGPVLRQAFRVRHARVGRNLERRHAIRRFAGDIQRLAAGRDDPHLGATAQDGTREAPRFVNNMLAIVENEQQAFALQIREQCLNQWAVRLLLKVQRSRSHACYERRIGDWCELRQPHAVAELVEELGTNLNCAPRFTNAARAG